MEEQGNLISAKEISKEFNISISTINFYTNLGMLPVSGKKKNMRLYDPVVVRKRIKEIQKLKDKGYPLRLIQNHILSPSENKTD